MSRRNHIFVVSSLLFSLLLSPHSPFVLYEDVSSFVVQFTKLFFVQITGSCKKKADLSQAHIYEEVYNCNGQELHTGNNNGDNIEIHGNKCYEKCNIRNIELEDCAAYSVDKQT